MSRRNVTGALRPGQEPIARRLALGHNQSLGASPAGAAVPLDSAATSGEKTALMGQKFDLCDLFGPVPFRPGACYTPLARARETSRRGRLPGSDFPFQPAGFGITRFDDSRLTARSVWN